MKDTKIPIGWLIPVVAGIILLLGWFLGHSGWSVTEVDGGVVKFAPPAATSTAQPPITTSDSHSQNRPASIHLKTGQTATLADSWIWICIGDFSITAPNGRRFNYYDVGGVTTGLVIVFEANSKANLSGPDDMPNGVDIGDCHPVSSNEKEDKLAWAINLQLRQGCTGSGCGSVRVVEIDRNYNMVNDYWK